MADKWKSRLLKEIITYLYLIISQNVKARVKNFIRKKVWPSRDSRAISAFASTEKWLTVFYNDSIENESEMKSYPEVQNNLLRR